MKKVRLLFLLLIVLFGMSSCMDTFYVTKNATFDKAVCSVQSQLAIQGFDLTGTSTNTRNEPVVTGVSYSEYTGYGSAMKNNYITQDTYRFADSLGNTMNYSVSYQARRTAQGEAFVENIELCGCETSNPKDFERMCGDESVVKQFNSLPKDQMVKRINAINTYLVGGGITVGLLLLLLALTAH